jgi:hypothetical protein
MRMLPYSLGSSLASVPAALFITHHQKKTKTTSGQKLVVMLGLMLSTIGFGEQRILSDCRLYTGRANTSCEGLMISMNTRTPVSLQEIAPLVAGVGIGMLFHTPYQVLTKALKPDDIASATSAFFLVRFTGATCGLVSKTAPAFCNSIWRITHVSLIHPLC